MPEYKFVIQVKDGRALIGLSKPDCDPVLLPFEIPPEEHPDAPLGLAAQVAALLPQAFDTAEAKWAAAPKYEPAPKLAAPPASAPRPVAAKAAKAAAATATAPAKPPTVKDLQQGFDLL